MQTFTVGKQYSEFKNPTENEIAQFDLDKRFEIRFVRRH